MVVLRSLTPLIQRCDFLTSLIIPDDLKADCQRYIRTALNLSTSAGRSLNILNNDACLYTMKLSINVSQTQTTLSCGHESRYVATTTVGNYTVGLGQGPRRPGPVGAFTVFVTETPVLGERFEGTKYRLEFFLPPVRLRTQSECPTTTMKTSGSSRESKSGGKKEGSAEQKANEN
jgi:hypothetical protein